MRLLVITRTHEWHIVPRFPLIRTLTNQIGASDIGGPTASLTDYDRSAPESVSNITRWLQMNTSCQKRLWQLQYKSQTRLFLLMRNRRRRSKLSFACMTNLLFYRPDMAKSYLSDAPLVAQRRMGLWNCHPVYSSDWSQTTTNQKNTQGDELDHFHYSLPDSTAFQMWV